MAFGQDKMTGKKISVEASNSTSRNRHDSDKRGQAAEPDHQTDFVTLDRSGPPDYREKNGFHGASNYDRNIFVSRLRKVLNSKPDGFIHPNEILEQLWEKYMIDGNEVAERNGYILFERLLKSPDFADVVNFKPVTEYEGLARQYTFLYTAKND